IRKLAKPEAVQRRRFGKWFRAHGLEQRTDDRPRLRPGDGHCRDGPAACRREHLHAGHGNDSAARRMPSSVSAGTISESKLKYPSSSAESPPVRKSFGHAPPKVCEPCMATNEMPPTNAQKTPERIASVVFVPTARRTFSVM